MQQPLETIIVENDLKDLTRLLKKLDGFKDVLNVTQQAIYYKDAVTMLSNKSYEVAILDIFLNNSKDCYELIKEVGRNRFGILVITTGKEAIPPDKAYSVREPVIFFPKPHTEENTIAFIKNLNEKIQELGNGKSPIKKFPITASISGRSKIFNEDEIYVIEANNKGASIYYVDKETDAHLVFKSCDAFHILLEKIESSTFVQCHRSYLVNTKFIEGYISTKKDGRQLFFNHNESEQVPYTQAYIETLSKCLNTPPDLL